MTHCTLYSLTYGAEHNKKRKMISRKLYKIILKLQSSQNLIKGKNSALKKEKKFSLKVSKKRRRVEKEGRRRDKEGIKNGKRGKREKEE